MDLSTYESVSHAKWDCNYHIEFVPKGAQEGGARRNSMAK